MFLRSSEGDEGDFSQWNRNHMPQEISAFQLPMIKENMKRNIDLLRSNITLFKRDGEERLGDKNTIVFVGAITPDSAVGLYNKSIRDYYLVEDKDLTDEEAKKEIKTSDITELKTGIPGLALSPEDIPVKIWIDEETHLPIKLELDKTTLMQEQLGDEKVDKAYTVYSLTISGPQVSISTPAGIVF